MRALTPEMWDRAFSRKQRAERWRWPIGVGVYDVGTNSINVRRARAHMSIEDGRIVTKFELKPETPPATGTSDEGR